MDFLADTGFLIDLWREARNPGPATRFARENARAQVAICWVVEGEFLCGIELSAQDPRKAEAFLASYPVVHSTPGMTHRYASIFAELRRRNQLIGPNDLWIAACAVELGCPLITRNVDEFCRVESLKVVDYRA